MSDVLDQVVQDYAKCSVGNWDLESFQNLLPIEKAALEGMTNAVKLSEKGMQLAKKYPIIDIPEALSFTSGCTWMGIPLPEFAVFDVDSVTGTCSVGIRNMAILGANNSYGLPPWLHQAGAWWSKYTDKCQRKLWKIGKAAVIGLVSSVMAICAVAVAPQLGFHWALFIPVVGELLILFFIGLIIESHWNRTTLTCNFTGILPDRIRSKIKDAKAEGIEHVYLFMEAPEWDKKLAPMNLDPLLIGVADQAFFLLDKFDLTPVEEYIAREFSTGPSLPKLEHHA